MLAQRGTPDLHNASFKMSTEEGLAIICKSYLTCCVLTAILATPSVFAQSRNATPDWVPMPSQFNLNAVPDPLQPNQLIQTLTLHADRPGDALGLTGKRSLIEVPRSQVVQNDSQISNFLIKAASGFNPPMPIAGLESQYRAYSNFMHGLVNTEPFSTAFQPKLVSNFWNLAVPANVKVKQAIFQIQWFGEGTGGHAQIRFLLDQPLAIFPQASGGTGSLAPRVIPGDLVYTLFTLRSERGRQDWGAVTGLTGAFANAYSVGSTQTLAELQTGESLIEQYELNLNDSQLNALFAYALARGTRSGHSEIYNLVLNSCITAAMQALNVADSRVNPWIFNPYILRGELSKLNLLGRQLQSLNQEFNSPRLALETPSNRANLELVKKHHSAITSPQFQSAVQLIAFVVARDKWNAAELEFTIGAFRKAQQQLSTPTPGTPPRLVSQRQLIDMWKQELAKNATFTQTEKQALNAKANRGIGSIAQGFQLILRQQPMNVQDLMTLLSGFGAR